MIRAEDMNNCSHFVDGDQVVFHLEGTPHYETVDVRANKCSCGDVMCCHRDVARVIKRAYDAEMRREA